MRRLIVITDKIPAGGNPEAAWLSGAADTYAGKGAFESVHWFSPGGSRSQDSAPHYHEVSTPGPVAESHAAFCSLTLWPLLHTFPSYAEYNEACFEGYRKLNETMAAEVTAFVTKDDAILVDGYQWLLLPGMISAAQDGHKVAIAFQTPFPSYELFKLLPGHCRDLFLHSLMSARVIGFQSSEHATHFRSTVSFFRGAAQPAREFPAMIRRSSGVEFEKITALSLSSRAVDAGSRIRRAFPHVKIILAVGRLDYTDGMMQRLNAFEELIQDMPSYRRKVVLLLNVIPSADRSIRYLERRRLLQAQVSRINGTYGNVSWQPVVYRYAAPDIDEEAGYMLAADVGLFTPVRAGRNLYAHRFVALRSDLAGVVVMSEFIDDMQAFRTAERVNPVDVKSMKSGLVRALSAPAAQQKLRMEELRRGVADLCAERWLGALLDEMEPVAAPVSAQRRNTAEPVEVVITESSAPEETINNLMQESDETM
jgi:trehalose 6-phosphate synthase/phosphatase